MSGGPVGPRPVEPRPAATVVLLRPGPDGRSEVLLTHRPTTMAFAPDVHVFPGGRVDDADHDPALAARSVVGAEDAARAIGGDLAPRPALAAHIAGIRELFEEAGILLAESRSGAGPAEFEAARAGLLTDPAAFPAIADALDLQLRTDLLVPLSRWVTPPTMPRRFDTRFFAAALPAHAEATLVGEEVLAQTWHTPLDALEAMAEGRLSMWLPTSTTLQQLVHADSMATIRERLAPGDLGGVEVETVSDDLLRITMPAGGGVAGQPVHAYLVGRRTFVLIDPGDPTGPGLDNALAEVARREGAIEAIALTHADPDHAAGAEVVAQQLGIPILVGPGGDRHLPYEAQQLGDGESVGFGDVPLRVVATPGPRVDHLAFVVGGGALVISGDLDGVRGARMIPDPPDLPAWRRSEARLRSEAPAARWLGGHPS